MKWWMPVLMAALVGAGLWGCGSDQESGAVGPAWAGSLRDARSAAAEKNTLVMMKFYADW